MDGRIEEFAQDGKSFVYFDLSGFKDNDEYKEFAEAASKCAQKYAAKSLYTITNIKDASFDTETKEIAAEWMKQNEPYVKYGAVVGIDGIKRIIVNAAFKMSGRKNMAFKADKAQAVEWLLSK